MRKLQIAVALASLVPISGGLAGVILGPDMLSSVVKPDVDLDSHYRYLSGLLLGIGLGFWSCVPGIALKTTRFQLLGLIVMIGGFARLLGVIVNGCPTAPMLFALAMELAVTPALCLWQWRASPLGVPLSTR